MELLAVGVPVVTGPAQGWNFWPIIGIPLALLVTLRWLRLPRTASVVVAAILAGLLTADAVAWWGVVPAAAVVAVATVLVAVGLRAARRKPASDV
ncbi:MAG TPA: hypothetical protein VG993_05040 [Actinomycetota bacterium]|jgi:hypothetical protein|nr:hypothetical protein [Actinomycetota bacterium]